MEEKSKSIHKRMYSYKKDRSSVTIDVVIISRNRPEKLFRAACSLVSNSIVPNSIIIIDSSDIIWWYHLAFYRLCKRVSINFVYKHVSTPGVSSQRNMGIRLSTGDNIAFLDDDEIAPIKWIATLTALIRKNDSYGVITGTRLSYHPNNYWNKVWEQILHFDKERIGYRDFMFASNTCIRKNFLLKYNLFFDERINVTSEDVFLSHIILQTGHRIYADPSLYIYHDFRTTLFSFMKQWWLYGYGTYECHYYLKKPNRRKNPLEYCSPLFMSMQWAFQFTHVRLSIIIGLYIRDVAFIFGYGYAMFNTLIFSTTTVNRVSSE